MALYAKGLVWTPVAVPCGSTRSPEFRAVNPLGKIPALWVTFENGHREVSMQRLCVAVSPSGSGRGMGFCLCVQQAGAGGGDCGWSTVQRAVRGMPRGVGHSGCSCLPPVRLDGFCIRCVGAHPNARQVGSRSLASWPATCQHCVVAPKHMAPTPSMWPHFAVLPRSPVKCVVVNCATAR